MKKVDCEYVTGIACLLLGCIALKIQPDILAVMISGLIMAAAGYFIIRYDL